MSDNVMFCWEKICKVLSCSVLLATGCSLKPKSVLEYEQFMSSRVNPQAQVEFAFALAWRWDADYVSKWRQHQMEQAGNMRTPRSHASDLLRPSLSAEQRLQIEEDAVRRLPDSLKQQQLCPKGYRIDDVIWESNRIRIMGRCTSS